MAISDVFSEKDKWLCEQWPKAALDLREAVGELREYVGEICRSRPWEDPRVVNSGTTTSILYRLPELANDERLAALVRETRELAVRLRRED